MTGDRRGGRLDDGRFLEIVRDAPLVAIDLIVRDDRGRALLGRRVHAPARSFWFVPGGRIRKDERIADAFARVVREELGVERSTESAGFLGVFEHLYDDNVAGEPGFGTHYVVLAYELRLPAMAKRPPDDQHSAYRWFTADELLEDADVHPYTKAYFRPVPRRSLSGPLC